MITDIFTNGVSKNMYGAVSWEDTNSLGFTFDTTEAAEEFAANFPKYCKVKLGRISSHADRKIVSHPHATLSFRNDSNGVTGEKNETAIKRKNKIREILDALNIDITK